MKVAITLEVNDAERNAISLMLHPKAKKRLATRDEVRQFVIDQVALVELPESAKAGEVDGEY